VREQERAAGGGEHQPKSMTGADALTPSPILH
jgi:hypothetical protein